jgi:prolyl-tRNA editing enzyme YbaK/EbsC (Cys-tRNA(Pro) deacylase)
MDSAVLENDLIRFNAASRTHSIEMRASDLAEVVKPTVGEITEIE